MSEAAPVQQQEVQDRQNPWDMNVGDLHDAIANNELPAGYSDQGVQHQAGEYVWQTQAEGEEAKAQAESGRVADPLKARKMAYAAKTGIDSVLEVVEARDHDNHSTVISATFQNKDGSFSGGIVNPNGHGTQLVTKPRRVELVDESGQKTGRTGVRAETYGYADLANTIKDANNAANKAGMEYDKKNAS